MSIILRRRYQRAEIGGTRFLFLATLRREDCGNGRRVDVEYNEVMRVIETKTSARLAKVNVLEGELKDAALRFAGLTAEDLE